VTYRASTGFSGSQGANQWLYQFGRPGNAWGCNGTIAFGGYCYTMQYTLNPQNYTPVPPCNAYSDANSRTACQVTGQWHQRIRQAIRSADPLTPISGGFIAGFTNTLDWATPYLDMNAAHTYPGADTQAEINQVKANKRAGKPLIIEEIAQLFGPIEGVMLQSRPEVTGISHNSRQYTPAQFDPVDTYGLWRKLSSIGIRITRDYNPAGLR